MVEALEGVASVLESLEVCMEFAIKPSIIIITTSFIQFGDDDVNMHSD